MRSFDFVTDVRIFGSEPSINLAYRDSSGLVLGRSVPWTRDTTPATTLPQNRLLCLPDIDVSDADIWRHRMALVSSRPVNASDRRQWWYDLLRTAVIHSLEERQSLVVVRSTATAEATARAAELFGCPRILCDIVPVTCTSPADTAKAWLAACRQRFLDEPKPLLSGPTFRIWISPPISLLDGRNQASDLSGECDETTADSSADWLSFLLATRIHVLTYRTGGIIDELMRNHVRQRRHSQVPVLIATRQANEATGQADVLPEGCIPWIVEPHAPKDANEESLLHGTRSTRTSVRRICHRRGPNRMESTPLSEPEDWLCHWTRAARGPWPDESREDFLDRLILSCDVSDRSALSTLIRILRTKTILASSLGIRGGSHVVSLTEVPLIEFRDRRIYRKHRHRFDFEPFGIAIRRTAILSLSARPVHYGDSDEWNVMPDTDRPWFQKATADHRTNTIAEREWRVLGDIQLDQLPCDDVWVFVDCEDHLTLIQDLCPWPVLCVPGRPASGTS